MTDREPPPLRQIDAELPEIMPKFHILQDRKEITFNSNNEWKYYDFQISHPSLFSLCRKARAKLQRRLTSTLSKHQQTVHRC